MELQNTSLYYSLPDTYFSNSDSNSDNIPSTKSSSLNIKKETTTRNLFLGVSSSQHYKAKSVFRVRGRDVRKAYNSSSSIIAAISNDTGPRNVK